MMNKCTQCKYPWYDGMCSCGGWGEEEAERAREWHEKNAKKKGIFSKRQWQAEIDAIDATMTQSIEELEDLW